jgi:release factor glutamine methyltransferase
VLPALWRVWLRLRFTLFQRHRHDALVLERVAGQPLVVLPQVLNPRLFESGAFLARSLGPALIGPGAAVLDMGSGSGVGAVFAARWAGRVVAVDCNPEAVRCTRINALLHRVEARVEARQGDLFAPVTGERFDVVLFNPPYLRGTPRTLLDQALWSGDVIERFAAGLAAHLTPAGCALVLLSTIGELPAQLATFRAAGLAVTPVAQHRLISETMLIYRLEPISADHKVKLCSFSITR